MLVLLRMDGTEELSGDFEWQVDALSDQAGLDLHGLLGTHATVEIDHADGTRAFDGIVCAARARGAHENGFRYDLTLRPWLHVAHLRRNMRIFHDMTVLQIVTEVLVDYASLGAPHFEDQLTGDYPVLEYTVQYGESDADFVRRQLERHGISWSWRHEAGSHTMLLTDVETKLPQIPGASRPYYSVDGFHQHEEEHFSMWSRTERITTGAVRLTEYNFKIPTATQEVDQAGAASHPSGDIESYDWPGDYLTQDQGQDVVEVRLSEERGQAPRHEAAGDVVSLGAGWRVALSGDHVEGATGRTFVCIKALHRFRAQAYGSGEAGGDEDPYSGRYTLMPDDTPYRPERRTPAPRVHGPETAVVVGEGEIDCDEHGRILCQFHWDLEGAHTMRVRVSQNWASKGWGGMVIPRIGMEVIVEHLRGDPDKPIVTGCVYNGKNTPPYDLPQHKTRSTFRTNTHQGKGFNELRFEDERGVEEVYLHAQKDLTEKVEHNASKRVNNNDLTSVGGSKLEAVRWNSKNLVGLNYFLNVGGAATGDVFDGRDPEGLRAKAYDLTDDLENTEAFGNIAESCSGNRYNGVSGNQSESIGAAYSMSVGTGMNVRVGADATQTTGGTVRYMTSGDQITSVGGSSITLVDGEIILSNQNGGLIIKESGEIIITGKSLTIETSGDLTAKSAKIFLN